MKVRRICFLMLLFWMAGCSLSGPGKGPSRTGDKQPALPPTPPELEDRALQLNPEAIGEREIEEVLSRFSAPRIINLNGSFPLVTLEPFARFLMAMGYPGERIRNPGDGSYTYSSYMDSRRLAGMIAWFYEREGMRPAVIGYSQGGMLSVKVLHEFAGSFGRGLAVWNPFSNQPEERETIRDPLTGKERPVLGLRLGFASAIATGRFVRFLLGQWDMLSRLRKIPDSVDEFKGFHIRNDLLGGGLLGLEQTTQYYAIGETAVRNVTLPPTCSHFSLPDTEDLAGDLQTRDWINAYVSGAEGRANESPPLTQSRNIFFAAEIWYSIKKHWCIEVQRLVRARREGKGGL